MSRATVTLDLDIEAETELAIMVRDLDDRKVWLPKSKIHIHDDGVDVPEWLAIDKDLV